MDKIKEIRDYIDSHLKEGYDIKLCFKEILSEDDYFSEHLEVRGSSPIAIISLGMGDDMEITPFKKLFEGYYGLSSFLVLSHEVEAEAYRDEYRSVIESMNINTLEIKQLDIQIY
jgi:hypothetical protein